MPAPAAVLDDLRAQLARIEQDNASISVSPLSLSFRLDRHLSGGNLARGALRLNQLDMTASSRLQLAVEGSERIGLLLRTEAAGQGPTATTTRWRAASLPDPAAEPGWQLDLLRCRGGRPGSCVVELQSGEIRAVPSHRMRSA